MPTIALALVLAIAWAVPRHILAAPGDRDPSFGVGGLVVYDPGPGDGNAVFDLESVVLQPDGKIAVAGYIGIGERDLYVARFAADGSIDPGFGVGGEVRTDLPGFSGERAHALALQPDGKLIAAGRFSG